MLIGVVSQKGGVGKSTLARLIACQYALAGWRVKIADMDTAQGTTYDWQSRRLENAVQPEIAVEQFSSVDRALRLADEYDLMIFDSKGHATKDTLQIAAASNLVILPTGTSLDDLKPTIRLAHELKQKGADISKIAVALCRVGDSEAEIQEAADYITESGYYLLPGEIPEKTSYRRASDAGRSVAETPFQSLNARAVTLIQSIVNRATQLEKQGAA